MLNSLLWGFRGFNRTLTAPHTSRSAGSPARTLPLPWWGKSCSQNGHWGRCRTAAGTHRWTDPSPGCAPLLPDPSGEDVNKNIPLTGSRANENSPLVLLTWSFRNMSLATWTIFSTWTIEPMLGMSTSASMVSTRMASTSSCRYSGWGTRFRTVSTWTENLISPGVIWGGDSEAGATTFNLLSTTCRSCPYLSGGWGRKDEPFYGQTVTLRDKMATNEAGFCILNKDLGVNTFCRIFQTFW